MPEENQSWKGFWGWILLLVIAGGIAAGLYFAFQPKFDRSRNGVSDEPGATVRKYAEALKLAMQFFDIQKSGKLEDNKIKWRGDSALDDGSEANLNLSQGLYDAGDHMKFGFPMAYTATMLSWAILEYGDQIAAVEQFDHAKEIVRWITDYLINAHPEDNVLYIQVGDPELDHECWDRPETMSSERPLTQINTTKPGTEVAAETAAAMAAASLVFKDDANYSKTLLAHATKLFKFADKYRGRYSVNIPEVAKYYNSTGYGDELLWAASWLYHVTKEDTYLYYVRDNGPKFANFGKPSWFSWDNKLAGTQVLLARLTFFAGKDISQDSGIDKYKETAELVICSLIPSSPTATTDRTEGGLIWINEWHAFQHPMAAAFLAVVYSDYMLTSKTVKITCKADRDEKSYKPSDLRDFAVSQANYVLGENPMKMSYIVGLGKNYPKYLHHRGASIPADANTGCKDGWEWLESSKPNPNIAYGALVGGPFKNDTYIDSRNNSKQGEPSTYNNALVVGLLSGLVSSSSVVKSFT